MLHEELDERLPALPAIDATTQIRIERDRALDKPGRNARVPEPARVHERTTDLDPLIRSICIAGSPRFFEPHANCLFVTKRGENGKCLWQCVLSREEVQHSCRSGEDQVLPRSAFDLQA